MAFLIEKRVKSKIGLGGGSISPPPMGKMLKIPHYTTNSNCLTTPVSFFCPSAPLANRTHLLKYLQFNLQCKGGGTWKKN